MGRSLKGLIRLHEWRVDEKRRRLGELQGLLSSLEEQAQALEAEIIDEQHRASEDPGGAGMFYGNYAKQAIVRRENLAKSIQEAEAQVEAARGELNQAFKELKVYEISQATRDKREASERDRREQGFLDEIGLQNHQRRNQGL